MYSTDMVTIWQYYYISVEYCKREACVCVFNVCLSKFNVFFICFLCTSCSMFVAADVLSSNNSLKNIFYVTSLWMLAVMYKKVCRGCIYKETTKRNLFVSYLSHYMYNVVRLCIYIYIYLISSPFISHISFYLFLFLFKCLERRSLEKCFELEGNLWFEKNEIVPNDLF